MPKNNYKGVNSMAKQESTERSAEILDISGYIRLINAVCQQIDKDQCPCSKCKKWKELQNDWCK